MADVIAEVEEGGIVRTLKDLFAGAMGGIAQVLLGMELVLSSCPWEERRPGFLSGHVPLVILALPLPLCPLSLLRERTTDNYLEILSA